MASTLLNEQGKDRVVDKGHGPDALGPGDTTDSGADIAGAPGVVEGEATGLDQGTNEDIDTDRVETLRDLAARRIRRRARRTSIECAMDRRARHGLC